MSGLDTNSLLLLLQRQPEGSDVLPLGKIIRFVSLACKLKNDILLTQPATVPDSSPPDVLPPSIVGFLSDSCELSPEYTVLCWEILKVAIWHDPDINGDRCGYTESLFMEYGLAYGLTEHTVYPPKQCCSSADCTRHDQNVLLKKAEQRQVVLYTLDRGPLPVYSVHLYCEHCHINYHHNFRVERGQRIYYDNIPDILQVGEHQFVERKVINLWISLMLVSWTSATNCARLYNISLSQAKTPPSGWSFGFTVTTEQVWDAVVILSLLEDCKSRNATLTVPHTGASKSRFREAIHARNVRFRLYSQPELRHHCKKCMRIYTDVNGNINRKVWVVVIDGVTIGHPCCAVHNCHNPLDNNRHRFCPHHSTVHNTICAIVGCSAPVLTSSLACSDPSHQEVERVHRERGQARFQLKERLQRARVAHPNDAIAEDIPLPQFIDDEEGEEEFELPELREASEAHRNMPRKKVRAQFGRRRSHNEQIIVAPCGMIIARETFYGAEGVGTVIEMIKRTFREDIKPDHIFFDNNCTLAKMVKNDTFFDDIALSVDVFHFNCKHSETDTFCQQNCNPAAFPELTAEGEGGWYFNSSIAEQTNVWLGGYHSICREMLVDKYNFFLDEMILRRNQATKQKLEKEGRVPQMWPLAAVTYTL